MMQEPPWALQRSFSRSSAQLKDVKGVGNSAVGFSGGKQVADVK